MSNDDLIIQSYNCVECGAMFKLHHNEIQESTHCPFCGEKSLEIIDEDSMPWVPDFDDSIDDEEWD